MSHCCIRLCPHQFEDTVSEFYIYILKNNLTPYDNTNVDFTKIIIYDARIQYELLPTKLEHIDRLEEYKDKLDFVPYMNESDFINLTPELQIECVKVLFCKYHAPILASLISNPTTTKKEFYNQGNNVEVFNNVIYNKLNIWKEIYTSIYSKKLKTFRYSKVSKKLTFQDLNNYWTNLSKTALYRKTSQLRDLNFTNIVFPDKVDFSYIQEINFDRHSRTLNLDGCYFENEVSFSKLKIQMLSLSNSRFIKKANFNKFITDYSTDFKSMIFFDMADFTYSNFKGGQVSFNNSVFYQRLEFGTWGEKRRDCFYGVSFDDCKFYGKVRFENTIIKSTATFKNTFFKDYIEFSKAEFYDGLHFNGTEEKKIEILKGISFRDTHFKRGLAFNYIHAESVIFTDSVFDTSFSFENNIRLCSH